MKQEETNSSPDLEENIFMLVGSVSMATDCL